MTRLAATVFGAGFGFVLAWAQLTDPERIRQMLAAQLGQGLWWGLLTFVGFLVGARLQGQLAHRRSGYAVSPSQ